jgi:asparagine synthase (glutamine-hydrolysing)
MKHRGPDDDGICTGENFLLGFRRLSILDLSAAGHQPYSSEDGRYHMVFNGEIYNFKSLTNSLPETCFPLKSNSDTEILFNLLIAKGAEALQYLNGMFAFAFIDTKANTCIIARDRLGVKPLYYSVEKGTIYFASELPSLLKFGLEDHQ